MNNVSKHNGSDSAIAHPSGHSSYANLTESEFLAHEAELAKTALSNTLGELKGHLAQAGNVKLWAHHYPWMTVGLAVATGFTLAAVAKRGSATSGSATSGSAGSGAEDGSLTASEELERQRLLRETAKAPYNATTAGKPKISDSLLGSLFSLARTALEASLVSAIREQGIQAQNQTHPQNVAPPAAPYYPAKSANEAVVVGQK